MYLARIFFKAYITLPHKVQCVNTVITFEIHQSTAFLIIKYNKRFLYCYIYIKTTFFKFLGPEKPHCQSDVAKNST